MVYNLRHKGLSQVHRLRAGNCSINNKVSLLDMTNNEGNFKNKVIQILSGKELGLFFFPVIGQKMFVLL